MFAFDATRLPKARTFRDPVHNLISWKSEGDVGRVIGKLIDAREVQRLRFVRQLGLASLVFHGAEHTRFTHSLGVAHVARRMCHSLGIEGSDRLVVLAAALLHDVGHAPFSHVMERVFGFHHEERSAAVVLDPDTEVHQTLASVDATLPERVVSLLSGEDPSWMRDVVSSQLDADRADYLLRDSVMTGIEVGRYDLERILLTLDHDDEGLVVNHGGYESVEGYLIARYHMYRLVYFHRAVRSAETMLESVFGRAAKLAREGDAEARASGPLARLMRGEEVPAVEWAAWGEYDAWAHIARWADHADPVLSGLADGLLTRRLFKSNEREAAPGSPEWARDTELADHIRESLAPNERALFYVDEAGDVPYRPYVPSAGRRGVRVRDAQGRVFFIEERSHVVRALAQASYRLRRWFYHPRLAPKLRRLVGDAW